MASAPDALVITGATACGKTSLSLAVARRLDGEIVSMDSRQVYRGMDIGTAKVTAAEAGNVPHHGLDLVEPDERYSAGAFARDARRWIGEIRFRGRVPILVGGTGFFLRALTHPLFHEPDMDEAKRERLKHWLARQPEERVRAWLRRLDPDRTDALAAGGGRQRVERALEVALLTGRRLSWWHAHAPAADIAPALRVFVIDLPRDQLRRRIDARVHDMVAAGLEGEVRRLMERGFDERTPGLNATGYVEILRYLRGETSLEAAVEAIQRATRHYARRQLTWLRHQLPPDAVHLDGSKPVAELTEEVVRMGVQESVS